MNNNYDTTTTTTNPCSSTSNSSDINTLVGNSVLTHKNSGCGKIHNNIFTIYYIMLGMMMLVISASDSQIAIIFQKVPNSNFDLKRGKKIMDLYKSNN